VSTASREHLGWIVREFGPEGSDNTVLLLPGALATAAFYDDLISPSFSRGDESKFPRVLDRLARVLGHLPYALMLKIIGPAIKGSLPQHRRNALDR